MTARPTDQHKRPTPENPPRVSFAIAVRYRLDRELGSRGKCTVYQAHDLKLDCDVTLWILWPEAAEAIGAEAFVKEMKVAAELSHPNILPIHDYGAAYASLYYATPIIDGETLTDRLKRERRLEIAEAVEITRAVAEALQYAHDRNFAHRDLKPDSIILTHDERVLVSDWGISLAIAQAGAVRMREIGMAMGVTQYLSPEQATGEHEVTGRSDIFALGCVAYEMLVGQPAFHGATPDAVALQVVTAHPRAPSALFPSIPPHVDGAVRTAIAKRPSDRFASAREFGEAMLNPQFVARATPVIRDSKRVTVPTGLSAVTAKPMPAVPEPMRVTAPTGAPIVPAKPTPVTSNAPTNVPTPRASPLVRAITPARASVAILLRASASMLARVSEKIDGRTREMPIPGLTPTTPEAVVPLTGLVPPAGVAPPASVAPPLPDQNRNGARASDELEAGRQTFEFEAVLDARDVVVHLDTAEQTTDLPLFDLNVEPATPAKLQTPSAPLVPVAPPIVERRSGLTPVDPPRVERRASRAEQAAIAGLPMLDTGTDWPIVEPVPAPRTTPLPPATAKPTPVAATNPPPVAVTKPTPVAVTKPTPVAAIKPTPVVVTMPTHDAAIKPVPPPAELVVRTPEQSAVTTPMRRVVRPPVKTATPAATPAVAAPPMARTPTPTATPLAPPPIDTTPTPAVIAPLAIAAPERPTPAPFRTTGLTPARPARPVPEPDIEDWFAPDPDDELASEPASEPAPAHVSAAPPRRSRRSAMFALAGSLVLLAIIGGSRFFRPAAPAAQPAVRFALRFPDTVAVAQAELSADGTRMVFVNASDELFANRLDQDGIRSLHKSAIDPFFSPDGKELGFTNADSTGLRVLVMPVDGGPTRVIADSAMHGSWGDDGQVYVVTAQNGVGRVAATGGRVEPLLAANDSVGRIARLVVLPGARTVLFSYYRGDGEVGAIGALDVAARTWTPLLRSADGLAYDDGFILFTRGNWLMAAPTSGDGRVLKGEPRKVIRSGSDGFQFFAQRAQTLVFQSSGVDARSVPVLKDRRGRERALPNVPAAVALSYPRVSPDGHAIAFTGQRHGAADRDVWIYQLPAGPLRALPSLGNEHARSFSPDGKRVLFSSDRSGKGALYARAWDGTGDAELALTMDGGDPLMGSWLPDGRHFVFGILRPQTQTGDLGIAEVGHPETVTMLTRGDFHEWSPTVSPDGKWLAYRSNESGVAQVYARSLESGTVNQLSQTGGYLPTWARNGREVYYENDGGDTLYVAQLQPGDRLSVTRRAPLWALLPGRGFDVLPGDTTFVTFRASGVATLPPPPMVVVNFRREIEKAAAP